MISLILLVIDGLTSTSCLKDQKQRLEFIIFTYNEIPEDDRLFLESQEAKGHHELYAINYAYKNSKLIIPSLLFSGLAWWI